LRYPHTGVHVQQHRALGMECWRILLLEYAAGKMAVKWAVWASEALFDSSSALTFASGVTGLKSDSNDGP